MWLIPVLGHHSALTSIMGHSPISGQFGDAASGRRKVLYFICWKEMGLELLAAILLFHATWQLGRLGGQQSELWIKAWSWNTIRSFSSMSQQMTLLIWFLLLFCFVFCWGQFELGFLSLGSERALTGTGPFRMLIGRDLQLLIVTVFWE